MTRKRQPARCKKQPGDGLIPSFVFVTVLSPNGQNFQAPGNAEPERK
jgi:hypothetical protein